MSRLTDPCSLVHEQAEDLAGVAAWALFDQARTHRYLLARSWPPQLPTLTWVMLNPSTADAFADDPTIRRCVAFARRDGYGGIKVVNLFALRAAHPADLRVSPDPVGAANDRILAAHACGTVVAAWGAGGALNGRGAEVAASLVSASVALVCLGVTKDGHPKHPLARGRERVPDDAPLVPWNAAELPAGGAPCTSAPLAGHQPGGQL
jgi:hypothetical protein